MKKLVKTLFSLLVAAGLFLAQGRVASAYTIPNFPTCSNPNGTLLVSYNSGTHGIVGSTAVYQGSDKVYSVANGNALQCFCAEDGSGIQTSWWKVSSLNQDEIQTLKNLGWYFIPDGSAWGLEEGAYMAKNNNYSCTTGGNPGNPTTPAGAPICTADQPSAPILLSVVRNGSKATLTWTKVDKATHYVIAYGTYPGLYPYGVPNTGNQTSYAVEALDPNKKYYFEVIAVNDCMPSVPSTQGGQVLGLASTGTSQFTLLLAALGLALTSAGYLLSRKSN